MESLDEDNASFITDLNEQEYLEMASIGYKRTGLNNIILWVGPNPDSPELRIKVSNIPNGLTGKNLFILTIPEFKILGEVNKELITPEILEKIRQWCNKNIRAITDYSEYKTSTSDFIEQLQPV